MTHQIEPHEIANAYIAVWNEPDQTRRLAQINAGWCTGARYIDPLMKGESTDGISAMIETARAQFPDHGFQLRGTPDGYGDIVRFSWHLAPADGVAVASGTDIVRLDKNGMIVEVIGFLDQAA